MTKGTPRMNCAEKQLSVTRKRENYTIIYKKFANSLIYSNLPVIINEKEKESKENIYKASIQGRI
jgi:hypothetical protein